MTEDEAFKELAAEALVGFGWAVTTDDIPDLQSITTVFSRITPWWNGLTQDTRDVISECDLAEGMWNKGWLTEFPAMYTMMSGNPFGRFSNTLDNIRASLANAKDRAPDYAAQHAVGRMQDDPDLQNAGDPQNPDDT